MDRESAFDDIFITYHNKLFYHAYSFLHDRQSALDVVNDTFEVLWKNFSALGDTAGVGAYLYSIVRRKSIDILRHRSVHQRFVDQIETQGLFPEDYDYSDYDLKLDAVRARIQSLPLQTRQTFILCHVDGYTYQQAADMLGISVNTVKTLLSRARKMLREELVPVDSL